MYFQTVSRYLKYCRLDARNEWYEPHSKGGALHVEEETLSAEDGGRGKCVEDIDWYNGDNYSRIVSKDW